MNRNKDNVRHLGFHIHEGFEVFVCTEAGHEAHAFGRKFLPLVDLFDLLALLTKILFFFGRERKCTALLGDIHADHVHFRHAVIDADRIIGLSCDIHFSATGDQIFFHGVDDLKCNVFFFDFGTVERPAASGIFTTVTGVQDNGISGKVIGKGRGLCI